MHTIAISKNPDNTPPFAGESRVMDAGCAARSSYACMSCNAPEQRELQESTFKMAEAHQ
jgi:hypothetical protein